MKKSIAYLSFLVLCLQVSGPLHAVLSYSMAVSSPGFTPLGPGKTLIPNLNNACGDQMVSSPVNMGFSFYYNGTYYTQFEVSDNGQLFLGAPGISCNENCGISCTGNYPHGLEGNDLSAGIDRPAICPLWDDLGFVAGGSGVSYLMTGTAPNRVMTVEWLLMDWKYNNSASPHGAISFQVLLYEAPAGQIDFIYRQDAQPLGTLSLAPSASIGLMGGAGDYYSTDNTGSAISKTSQTSIVSKPLNGVRYRWTNLIVPLPIELVSFTGMNREKGNLLEWKTASETNNRYFTVERSMDAIAFEALEIVKGQGNSSSATAYHYMDSQLPDLEGLLYYRLKQTDGDYAQSYSPIIVIGIPDKPPGIFFDESANKLLISCHLQQAGTYSLDVMDVTAKSVYSESIPIDAKGHALLKVVLPFSAKGLYLIKLIAPNGSSTPTAKFIR